MYSIWTVKNQLNPISSVLVNGVCTLSFLGVFMKFRRVALRDAKHQINHVVSAGFHSFLYYSLHFVLCVYLSPDTSTVCNFNI